LVQENESWAGSTFEVFVISTSVDLHVFLREYGSLAVDIFDAVLNALVNE